MFQTLEIVRAQAIALSKDGGCILLNLPVTNPVRQKGELVNLKHEYQKYLGCKIDWIQHGNKPDTETIFVSRSPR